MTGVSRFDLYCLEDGDEYFGEMIVDYSPIYRENGVELVLKSSHFCSSFSQAFPHLLHDPKVLQELTSSKLRKTKQFVDPNPAPLISTLRGRLRLGGRGILFEPDDWSFPLIFFRFRTIIADFGDRFEFDENEKMTFRFLCGSVYLLRTNGRIHPYRHDANLRHIDHVFKIVYSSDPRKILHLMNKLLALAIHSTHFTSVVEWTSAMHAIKATRDREISFPLTFFKFDDTDEHSIFEGACTRVAPLVREWGRIVVSTHGVYFQPSYPVDQGFPCESWSLSELHRIDLRRTEVLDAGLELTFTTATVKQQTSVLFHLPNKAARDNALRAVVRHPKSKPALSRMATGGLQSLQQRWSCGELSTFHYLMALNAAAGRSLNDLAQYPIMPWIIQNYTVSTMDFSNEEHFRDLSKPMGAITKSRLEMFLSRAGELMAMQAQSKQNKRQSSTQLEEEDLFGDAELESTPYLYGTHYSCPAYVAYFMLRLHPEWQMLLQSGRFDKGSRLFDSIEDGWISASTGPADVKELLPEFYYGNGSFLTSTDGPGRLDLGTKEGELQSEIAVRHNVALPTWAADSPQKFIEMHRAALEGPVVSRSIHKWIDLIFGCAQRGPEAWKANNVFHPVCYVDEDVADLSFEQPSPASPNSPSSPGKLDRNQRIAALRTARAAQRREFGQVPKQLFLHPHPPRQCSSTPPQNIHLEYLWPPESEERQEAEDEGKVSSPISVCSPTEPYASPSPATPDSASPAEKIARQLSVLLSKSPEASQFPVDEIDDDEEAELKAQLTELKDISNEFQLMQNSEPQKNLISAAVSEPTDSAFRVQCTHFSIAPRGNFRVSQRGLASILLVEVKFNFATWLPQPDGTDTSQTANNAVPLAIICDSSGVIFVADASSMRVLRVIDDPPFAASPTVSIFPVSSTDSFFCERVGVICRSSLVVELDLGSCSARHPGGDISNSLLSCAACTKDGTGIIGGGKDGLLLFTSWGNSPATKRSTRPESIASRDCEARVLHIAITPCHQRVVAITAEDAMFEVRTAAPVAGDGKNIFSVHPEESVFILQDWPFEGTCAADIAGLFFTASPIPNETTFQLCGVVRDGTILVVSEHSDENLKKIELGFAVSHVAPLHVDQIFARYVLISGLSGEVAIVDFFTYEVVSAEAKFDLGKATSATCLGINSRFVALAIGDSAGKAHLAGVVKL